MEQEKHKANWLERWGRWASLNWKKTFIIASGITVIMILGILNLNMEMTFFSILPAKSTQINDMKELMKNFPSASGIIVAVDGRNIKDADEAEKVVKKTVDEIVERLSGKDYSEYVSSVYGKLPAEFFKTHGMILTKADDLKRFIDIYKDLNIVPLLRHLNDDFEREYSGDEDALEEDANLVISQFNGLKKVLELFLDIADGKKYSLDYVSQVLEDFMFGDNYFLSNDNKMALVTVQPTFGIADIDDMIVLVPGVNTIEKTVKEIAAANGIKAGLTGMAAVARDETVTSEQGLVISMLAAIVLILLLLIFSFRMLAVPVIAGVPLITGILWACGMAGFIINRLNIVTAMYMIALVGLGIDYAIHILSTFIQERDAGESFYDAVGIAFRKSGSGIFIGALTTALAFFALITADTGLMQELGFIAGIGILSELAAMMIIIPAFLGFRYSGKQKKGKNDLIKYNMLSSRLEISSGIGKLVSRAPVIVTIILFVFGGLIATQAFKVDIETNLMNMEAKGLESIALQDTLVQEFNMAPDGLLLLLDNLNEVKQIENKLKDLDTVKEVESIAPYTVLPEERKKRVEQIEVFKHYMAGEHGQTKINSNELYQELGRLQMNLLELTDLAYLGGMVNIVRAINRLTGMNMDGEKASYTALDKLITLAESPDSQRQVDNLNHFQSLFAKEFKAILMGMALYDAVDLKQIPELIRDSFVYFSKDSVQYLVFIIPTKNPWEQDFRESYMTQVKTVTDKATGWILAGDQLTKIAETDGFRASIAALITIFLLLLIDFRNVKLTVLTMTPLFFSFFSLLGFMGLFGFKFDFINVISVPLLIGIGVDDAVHISHRYLQEGKGNMPLTISRTGAALLLTSITTIIAFASFIPSIMTAMQGTGIILSVVMAFAFIYSIFLHPALLIILVERINLNIKPWKILRRTNK